MAYILPKAIVKQDRCFLVEGYTDVISMHQSGIENVVALFGHGIDIRTNPDDSSFHQQYDSALRR